MSHFFRHPVPQLRIKLNKINFFYSSENDHKYEKKCIDIYLSPQGSFSIPDSDEMVKSLIFNHNHQSHNYDPQWIHKREGGFGPMEYENLRLNYIVSK